jgi:hypothetical protein
LAWIFLTFESGQGWNSPNVLPTSHEHHFGSFFFLWIQIANEYQQIAIWLLLTIRSIRLAIR